MTDQTERHPMTTKRVLYEIAGMHDVPVRRDVEYQQSSAGSLTMDVYYPPGDATASLPAIVIVSGYADEGFLRMLGCRFKEMASSVSWAQLLAMSGIVAIAYTNREPVRDVYSLLDFVVNNAAALGVDEKRIGLFATSGHGPLALSLLANDAATPLRSAILCYSYTMDIEDGTAVADAAKQWRFANAFAGRSVDDLRPNVPMFIARAGADEMPQPERHARSLRRQRACEKSAAYGRERTGGAACIRSRARHEGDARDRQPYSQVRAMHPRQCRGLISVLRPGVCDTGMGHYEND